MRLYDRSTWRATRRAISAIPVAVLLVCSQTANAAPASVPIEEIPAVGFEYSEYGEVALGPEDNIWTFQNETFFSPTYGLVERITPAGIPVGTFKVYDPSETSYDPKISALALGLDGNMWFTNDAVGARGHDRIGRISPTGEVTEFPIERSVWEDGLWAWEDTVHPCCMPYLEEPNYSMGPRDLAAGSDGAVWFTDNLPDEHGDTMIGRISPHGIITEHVIPSGWAPDMPTRSIPMGITTGPGGTIWFTDHGVDVNGRNLIGRIEPDGSITERAIPTRGSWPMAIAIGPEGSIWFTEPDVSKIGRLDANGEVVEFSVPSVSASMHGIIRGPDGDMWFATNEGFGRISPEGSVALFAAKFAGGSPRSLVADRNGDIWFTDTNGVQYTAAEYMFIGKLHVPLAPANTVRPAISGGSSPGEPLGVSPGVWEHAATTISYQWQTCDAGGRGCENIPDETGAGYVVRSGDLGHTLRAVVTAGNIAGAVSVASATSAVIGWQTGPPPAMPIVEPRLSTPVVGSTMTWRFTSRHGRTSVKSLMVHNAPLAAQIEVNCQAKACAKRGTGRKVTRFTRCSDLRCTTRRVADRSGTLNVTPFFAGISFGAGAHISINVVQPGVIGRSFNYIMRRRGAPTVRLSCLVAGSFTVGSSC